MAKDYKDPPSPRADSRLSHPMLLGMIIGLLLGILISLAVALWLNRLSNPFVEKGRPLEPLQRVQPVPPAALPDAPRTPEKGARGAEKPAAEKDDKAARPGERPRFEFYQILPGEKSADRDAHAAAKAPAPAPTIVVKPGSSPASPKPHGGDLYWLQAGAFTDPKEADNQKARIALTGLEANVRAAEVPGRGTLYRVRLGPYQSVEDANRMKSTLAQNGVAAAIIHTTEEAKNP
jgi:cell division protein FtsN